MHYHICRPLRQGRESASCNILRKDSKSQCLPHQLLGDGVDGMITAGDVDERIASEQAHYLVHPFFDCVRPQPFLSILLAVAGDKEDRMSLQYWFCNKERREALSGSVEHGGEDDEGPDGARLEVLCCVLYGAA